MSGDRGAAESGPGGHRRRRHRGDEHRLPPDPAGLDATSSSSNRASCPSGTTWHAAGLLGQLRATEGGTRLVQYSAQLYSTLEQETGLATGFKRCGGVTVARTEERMVQLRRTAATAAAYDLECELITPGQGPGALSGAGHRRPGRSHLAARRRDGQPGGRHRLAGPGGPQPVGPGCSSTPGWWRIDQAGGRVTGVVTDRGPIEAEVVVNCAGQWAKAVGSLAGVHVPLHSAEHFYVVSEQIDGVHPDLPILRDPTATRTSKRRWAAWSIGGLRARGQAVGGARPAALSLRVPAPGRGLGPLRRSSWRAPCSASRRSTTPASASSTTDRRASPPTTSSSSGEAPELRNFFVGAGFNSVGIASAGGAGRALAEWIVEGRTDDRSDRGRHPALRPLQRQRPVAARPGRRDPRTALRGPVAQPRAGQRPGRSDGRRSTTCWPGRVRCSVRRWDGSGPTSSPRPGPKPG